MLTYYENYIRGKYLYSRLDKNLCEQKDENYEFRKEIVDYVYNYETYARSKELLNFLPLVLFLYKNRNDIAFTNEKGDIYLNPNRFRSEISSIEEWEFIFCHECYHQVWDTFNVQKCIGKELGRCYPKVLNIASDCIINETLKASKRKVPTMVITAETIKRDFNVDYEEYDTQYSLYMKIINSDIFKQKQKEAEERKKQQQQQQNGQQGQQDQEGNESQGGNQQGQDEDQSQGQGQEGNESQQQGNGKQGGKQQKGGRGDDNDSGEEPLTNDDSLFDYDDYSQNEDGEGDEDGEDGDEQSENGNGKKSDKDSDNKEKKSRGNGDDEDEDGDGDGDDDGDDESGKDSDKSDKNGNNKNGDAQNEDGNEGKGGKNSQGQEDGDEDGQGQSQGEDGGEDSQGGKGNNEDGQGEDGGEDGQGDKGNGEDGQGEQGKDSQGGQGEDGGEDGIGKMTTDKEIGDSDIISDEELREVHKQAIEICQNAVTGMMKEFIGKCKSSTRLEKPKRKQVKIGQNFGGSNGSWDDKLLTTVLKFMDQRLNNSINHETKKSWGKINKNMIDFHKKYGKDILIPGRKKEEKKLYVKFAFFMDASGSMRNGRIKGASLAANAIADVVDNRYGDKIKKINNQNKKNNNINNKKKEEENEIHDFYAFYDEKIGIKKIKRYETPDSFGGTMSYVNLFKGFKNYGTDCLVNIIFTDAEQPFMPKDKEFLESFINSNDGLIVYLACTQHNRKMLEWLAEKNKGKFYYILSDNDFFVENDTLINSRNKVNESIFNIKKLDFIPLFEDYFYK